MVVTLIIQAIRVIIISQIFYRNLRINAVYSLSDSSAWPASVRNWTSNGNIEGRLEAGFIITGERRSSCGGLELCRCHPAKNRIHSYGHSNIYIYIKTEQLFLKTLTKLCIATLKPLKVTYLTGSVLLFLNQLLYIPVMSVRNGAPNSMTIV